MSDTDKNTRHVARMQRKKAVVNEHIASAHAKRGLFHIHTANGKGEVVYRHCSITASFLYFYFPSNPVASARLFLS